jgi:hypothetical protein
MWAQLGLRAYARKSLTHIKKASAINNAAEPKSKSGEASCIAVLPFGSEVGMGAMVPEVSPGAQTQLLLPHSHQTVPPIT